MSCQKREHDSRILREAIGPRIRLPCKAADGRSGHFSFATGGPDLRKKMKRGSICNNRDLFLDLLNRDCDFL